MTNRSDSKYTDEFVLKLAETVSTTTEASTLAASPAPATQDPIAQSAVPNTEAKSLPENNQRPIKQDGEANDGKLNAQLVAPCWRRVVAGTLAVFRASAGYVVLATVPLFLIFANTQLKELVDSFLGGCVLVIEKRVSTAGQLLVTARIAGSMPKGLPLMFEGRDALINTILFDEPYRQDRISDPDDLAFHPMTGTTCPGDLCLGTGDTPFRSRVQFLLRDLRPEFSYRFRLRMKSDKLPLETHNLKVYVMFDAGLADGVCRVQPPRWFNFWVWATPAQKAVLFLSLVVGGGLLLRWAKGTKAGG